MTNVKKQPTWTYIRSPHRQIRNRIISNVDNGDDTYTLVIKKSRVRGGVATEFERETITTDAVQRAELMERYESN